MKTPYIAIDGSEEFFHMADLAKVLRSHYGSRLLVTTDTGHESYAELAADASSSHPTMKNPPDEVILRTMFELEARHAHVVIAPTLDAGIPVIICRSDAARYAYQVAASGLRERRVLEPLFWDLRKKLVCRPDIYVVIDTAPPECLDQDTELHERICRAFRDFPNHVRAQKSIFDIGLPAREVSECALGLIDRQISRFG